MMSDDSSSESGEEEGGGAPLSLVKDDKTLEEEERDEETVDGEGAHGTGAATQEITSEQVALINDEAWRVVNTADEQRCGESAFRHGLLLQHRENGSVGMDTLDLAAYAYDPLGDRNEFQPMDARNTKPCLDFRDPASTPAKGGEKKANAGKADAAWRGAVAHPRYPHPAFGCRIRKFLDIYPWFEQSVYNIGEYAQLLIDVPGVDAVVLQQRMADFNNVTEALLFSVVWHVIHIVRRYRNPVSDCEGDCNIDEYYWASRWVKNQRTSGDKAAQKKRYVQMYAVSAKSCESGGLCGRNGLLNQQLPDDADRLLSKALSNIQEKEEKVRTEVLQLPSRTHVAQIIGQAAKAGASEIFQRTRVDCVSPTEYNKNAVLDYYNAVVEMVTIIRPCGGPDHWGSWYRELVTLVQKEPPVGLHSLHSNAEAVMEFTRDVADMAEPPPTVRYDDVALEARAPRFSGALKIAIVQIWPPWSHEPLHQEDGIDLSEFAQCDAREFHGAVSYTFWNGVVAQGRARMSAKVARIENNGWNDELSEVERACEMQSLEEFIATSLLDLEFGRHESSVVDDTMLVQVLTLTSAESTRVTRELDDARQRLQQLHEVACVERFWSHLRVEYNTQWRRDYFEDKAMNMYNKGTEAEDTQCIQEYEPSSGTARARGKRPRTADSGLASKLSQSKINNTMVLIEVEAPRQLLCSAERRADIASCELPKWYGRECAYNARLISITNALSVIRKSGEYGVACRVALAPLVCTGDEKQVHTRTIALVTKRIVERYRVVQTIGYPQHLKWDVVVDLIVDAVEKEDAAQQREEQASELCNLPALDVLRSHKCPLQVLKCVEWKKKTWTSEFDMKIWAQLLLNAIVGGTDLRKEASKTAAPQIQIGRLFEALKGTAPGKQVLQLYANCQGKAATRYGIRRNKEWCRNALRTPAGSEKKDAAKPRLRNKKGLDAGGEDGGSIFADTGRDDQRRSAKLELGEDCGSCDREMAAFTERYRKNEFIRDRAFAKFAESLQVFDMSKDRLQFLLDVREKEARDLARFLCLFFVGDCNQTGVFAMCGGGSASGKSVNAVNTMPCLTAMQHRYAHILCDVLNAACKKAERAVICATQKKHDREILNGINCGVAHLLLDPGYNVHVPRWHLDSCVRANTASAHDGGLITGASHRCNPLVVRLDLVSLAVQLPDTYDVLLEQAYKAQWALHNEAEQRMNVCVHDSDEKTAAAPRDVTKTGEREFDINRDRRKESHVKATDIAHRCVGIAERVNLFRTTQRARVVLFLQYLQLAYERNFFTASELALEIGAFLEVNDAFYDDATAVDAAVDAAVDDEYTMHGLGFMVHAMLSDLRLALERFAAEGVGGVNGAELEPVVAAEFIFSAASESSCLNSYDVFMRNAIWEFCVASSQAMWFRPPGGDEYSRDDSGMRDYYVERFDSAEEEDLLHGQAQSAELRTGQSSEKLHVRASRLFEQAMIAFLADAADDDQGRTYPLAHNLVPGELADVMRTAEFVCRQQSRCGETLYPLLKKEAALVLAGIHCIRTGLPPPIADGSLEAYDSIPGSFVKCDIDGPYGGFYNADWEFLCASDLGYCKPNEFCGDRVLPLATRRLPGEEVGGARDKARWEEDQRQRASGPWKRRRHNRIIVAKLQSVNEREADVKKTRALYAAASTAPKQSASCSTLAEAQSKQAKQKRKRSSSSSSNSEQKTPLVVAETKKKSAVKSGGVGMGRKRAATIQSAIEYDSDEAAFVIDLKKASRKHLLEHIPRKPQC